MSSSRVCSEVPNKKSTSVSAMCSDLLKTLEKTGYTETVDSQALLRGSTVEFISVLRFILVGLSRYVHKSISASGYKFSLSNVNSFMTNACEAIKSEFGIFAEVRIISFFSIYPVVALSISDFFSLIFR